MSMKDRNSDSPPSIIAGLADLFVADYGRCIHDVMRPNIFIATAAAAQTQAHYRTCVNT